MKVIKLCDWCEKQIDLEEHGQIDIPDAKYMAMRDIIVRCNRLLVENHDSNIINAAQLLKDQGIGRKSH